jgi:hypothetical protein
MANGQLHALIRRLVVDFQRLKTQVLRIDLDRMTFGKLWSMAVFERIDENQRGSHNLVMFSMVNRQQPTVS